MGRAFTYYLERAGALQSKLCHWVFSMTLSDITATIPVDTYPLKEKSQAKFWLMEGAEDSWAIIYNKDGVEIIKK